MGRYTGPLCKLCRREKQKLYLKGTRCHTDKCAIESRNYPPGVHGQRMLKHSDYGLQLREKQKVKRIYGIFETQFRRMYVIANKMKGVVGTNLLQLCERRLDNVVFRSGFALNRNQARQLVNHGHVRVNGKKVDIASYSVKVDDKIDFKPKSKTLKIIELALESKVRAIPGWIEADSEVRSAKVVEFPSREQIDLEVNEQLIVELYSK